MFLLIPRQHPSSNSEPDRIQDASFEGRARLDNRSELSLSLGIPVTELASFSDRTLILKAYIKWGHLCVDHLLGDFAFSIFDPKNDEIFCARDHMGIAPFYFCLSDDNFVFADNIRQLIDEQLVSSTLDDHAVCCYLRDGVFYHREKTFYRDITKLPPGHAMRICNWEQSRYAYWSLDACGAMEFESQQDCSDQLRKLLAEAVSSRIPNTGSFGIHLSGGLDSSGIAAISRKVLNAPAEDVRGYTWNFEPQTQEELSLPEVASLSSLVENLGIPLHYSNLSVDQLHTLLCAQNVSYGDTTDCWSEWSVRENALCDGVTTIVSGWGGDQFITHHGTHRYADLLVTGRPLEAMAEIWRAVKPSLNPLRRFFSVSRQLIFNPIFSALSYRVLHRVSHRMSREVFPHTDYLIAAKSDIRELALTLPSEISGTVALSVRNDQLNSGSNLHLTSRIESWSAACEGKNLSYAYPLLDKRIVEFAMGMDSKHFCHNGITRYTFRDAIKDLLPEDIVFSSHKQEPKRALRDLSVCLAAIDKWKQGRLETTDENRFIDERKLHALIDELQTQPDRPDGALSAAAVERVGAIIRSIFVINVCEQAAARA